MLILRSVDDLRGHLVKTREMIDRQMSLACSNLDKERLHGTIVGIDLAISAVDALISWNDKDGTVTDPSK